MTNTNGGTFYPDQANIYLLQEVPSVKLDHYNSIEAMKEA